MKKPEEIKLVEFFGAYSLIMFIKLRANYFLCIEWVLKKLTALA